MGNAAIFAGQFVKLLKNNIMFGTNARFITGTDDPTKVAYLAEAGSFFLRIGPAPAFYQKLDEGLTTNWRKVVADDITIVRNTSTTATVAGGFVATSDGRIMATSNGSPYTKDTVGVPLTLTMSTLVPSPVVGTAYNIYIDTSLVAGLPVQISETGLKFYPILPSTFVASTNDPSTMDSYRYIFAGSMLYSAGGWASGASSSAPIRMVPSNISAKSPVVFTQPATPIGVVGLSGQIRAGHVLTTSDVPAPARDHWSLAQNTNYDSSFVSVIPELYSNMGGGTGYYQSVAAICSDGTNIYIGGAFSSVGGVANTSKIAKWNGTAWSSICAIAPVGGDIRALVVANGHLYVGGDFTAINGVTASRLAKYNLTTGVWSAVSTGVTNSVYALATDGTRVYVGGWFLAGGMTSNQYLFSFDPVTETVSTAMGAPNGPVNAMYYYAPTNTLWLGGHFTVMAGTAALRLAGWSVGSSSWSMRSSFGPDQPVWAVTVHPVTGRVWLGGDFQTILGVSMKYIAQYATDNSWHNVGTAELNGTVYALAHHGSYMYVGGQFSTIGSTTYNKIARWDGTSWSAFVDSGSTINALYSVGTTLYVGGYSQIGSWGGNVGLGIASYRYASSTGVGNMTNVGGAFTGTDMFGATNNALANGYAYVDTNHAATGTWSWGAWVKSSASWANAEGIMGEGKGTNGLPVWELYKTASNGRVYLRVPQRPATGAQADLLVGVDIDTTQPWHHFVVTITANAPTGQDYGRVRVYVDGVLKVSETLRGALNVAGASRFYVGSSPSYLSSATKTMTVREAYYATAVMSGDYVARQYAYQLTHGRAIAGSNQQWIADYVNANGVLQEPLTNDWLVDKSDPNSVLVQFRQFEATDTVSLKLLDLSSAQLRVLVPKSYDSGWLSSAPSFPMAHNLPDVPSSVSLLLESTPGQFTALPPQTYLTWDGTNFTGNSGAIAGLGIGPTKRLRIIAVHAAHPVNMEYGTMASSGSAGLMSATDQTLAGNKSWSGNQLPAVDAGSSLGSATKRWDTVYAHNLNAPGVMGLTYDALRTYHAGEIVNGTDGVLYKSLIDGNAGFTPSANPTKWKPVRTLGRAGDLKMYAGGTVPAGWALCDGSEMSESTYAELFANIGTAWNTAVDPSTGVIQSAPSVGNFRLPNLKNAFMRGAYASRTVGSWQDDATAANGLGAALASGTVSGTATSAGAHTHDVTGTVDGGANVNYGVDYTVGGRTSSATTSGGAHTHSLSASVGTTVNVSSTDTETRPANVAVTMMVKLWNDEI